MMVQHQQHQQHQFQQQLQQLQQQQQQQQQPQTQPQPQSLPLPPPQPQPQPQLQTKTKTQTQMQSHQQSQTLPQFQYPFHQPLKPLQPTLHPPQPRYFHPQPFPQQHAGPQLPQHSLVYTNQYYSQLPPPPPSQTPLPIPSLQRYPYVHSIPLLPPQSVPLNQQLLHYPSVCSTQQSLQHRNSPLTYCQQSRVPTPTPTQMQISTPTPTPTSTSTSTSTTTTMSMQTRTQTPNSTATSTSTSTHVTPTATPISIYTNKQPKSLIQTKRKRRRYSEIDRMFKCTYNGCTKAYGTLNHLNFHIHLQGHGKKKTWSSFRNQSTAATEATATGAEETTEAAMNVSLKPTDESTNKATSLDTIKLEANTASGTSDNATTTSITNTEKITTKNTTASDN